MALQNCLSSWHCKLHKCSVNTFHCKRKYATAKGLQQCRVTVKGANHPTLTLESKTHLSISITHKNHLLHEFSIRVVLGHHLPEDQQKFLDSVILHGHHKANHCHQQGRHLLSIQDHLDHLLQGLNLGARVPLFYNSGRDTPCHLSQSRFSQNTAAANFTSSDFHFFRNKDSQVRGCFIVVHVNKYYHQ